MTTAAPVTKIHSVARVWTKASRRRALQGRRQLGGKQTRPLANKSPPPQTSASGRSGLPSSCLVEQGDKPLLAKALMVHTGMARYLLRYLCRCVD